ncbi:MAG TPA: amidohydrolase family protein [Gaiellales bacterium]|nr:amidohydrolase family protein [Gaiellales bacterium]
MLESRDMVDLSQVPFTDGHMHPPLCVRPQTVEEYRWPWFEGLPSESEHVAELVPYRWAIRQIADELGCAADERAVVRHTRELDPLTWLATVCERSQTIALVLDTGYPPPDESLPLDQIRAAGVEVAPLLRLEAMAGDLIAEGLGFADLIERYDATVAGARAAGYAGLKTIAAYRSGLAIRPWSAEEAAEALARQRAAGVTRVQEQALVDFLLLRALPVARRDDLPVQLHAGYGDRDLDLRLVNPLHLRGMLSSDAAAGVHFVVLHAAWPYVREGAFLTAVYSNVTLDVATCIPPLGHAALLEAWRCALAVGAMHRLQASSDAAGLPEQIALGAARARSTLGQVLGELISSGELSAGEAERCGEALLSGNSRRLYFGEP